MRRKNVETAVNLDGLFRAHATPLLRLAVVLTGDRGLGEELVQDAFVRLARSATRPAPGAELAYLRRIVINLSHGHHRHLAVVRRHEPGPPGDAAAADASIVGRDATPMPEQVVAVTQDGRLVTVDVDTGKETSELYALDDPSAETDEFGESTPYSISGVRVHGSDVYLETCCEPAAGTVLRTPVDEPGYLHEHEHETVLLGSFIDVSGDGTTMTGMSGPYLTHLDLVTDHLTTFEPDVGEVHEYGQTAVNRDGTEVAVERVLERAATGEPVRSEVIVFDVSGPDLQELDRITEGNGRLMPYFDRDGTATAALRPEGGRSVAIDPSGQWPLVVHADGTLWWLDERDVAHQIRSELTFLAADW